MEDSLFAQSIADREGPQATIRASFANISGSRRVQGTFRVADDAYVLVGHIDAEGTVRVIFPLNPQDDGFVRGSKNYQTQEVFAGFIDSYRQRYTASLYSPAASMDSYDRGFGYMFIIASWRPMRFDRLATENRWDAFDLAEASSLDNPRAAIQEFASILAGENREAYSVEFARYYQTQGLYSGLMNASYSSFGYGFCSNYSGYGLGGGPFFGSNSFFTGLGAMNSFWYRGTLYYADASGDCYRPATSFPGYGYGFGTYRIANIPTPYDPRPRPRFFDPEGHRTPMTPKGAAPHTLPTSVADGPTNAGADLPQASPRYRERGLITADDPTPRTGRNAPRIDARAAIDEPRRPSIQDMMTHRVQSENAENAGGVNGGWSRIQRNARDNSFGSGGSNGSETRSRVRTDYPRSGGSDDSRGTYRAPSTDSPRQAPSSPRSEPAQRSAPVYREPSRSEPVQRSVPATSEPRSAPVSAPASSSPPASSGGAASGSRPGTP